LTVNLCFQALALEGDPLIPGDSANVVGGGVRPHNIWNEWQGQRFNSLPGTAEWNDDITKPPKKAAKKSKK